MKGNEIAFFRGLFIVSAMWNLMGAGFGYFNTAYTFEQFFSRELTDPLFYSIYQGAWGTTFVYLFGYLIVAYRPLKHPGIVIVGGIGKLGFAISLLKLYFAGIANPIVFIVIIGDLTFVSMFLFYFYRLYKTQGSVI